MSDPAATVPYEKQSDPQTNRGCGAACLSMAYRSFGQEVAQTEIWPVIAKANRFGQMSSTTHLMAQDALNRGFSAVAFQARHPFQVLRLCHAAGVRAILNHRVQRDSPRGHYTLLVDIDRNNVLLHDPLFGPARPVSHAELAELWLSQVDNSEIAGGVVIAIAPAKPSAAPSCEFCHTPMPTGVACPRCGDLTSLQPAEALGCAREGCIARMWNWVCCPKCDYVFTFDPGAAATAPAPRPSGSAVPPLAAQVDVAKVFEAMDKFTSLALSVPAAALNPDIKKQLEFIAEGKEKFRIAYAEQMAQRTAVLGQLAALAENHKQQEQAQVKKMEQLNAPQAPLDGNALGRALLKNLGFVK